MSPFVRLYDKVVDGLAALAGMLLVWLMVSVVVSVFIRNFGGQPPAWLFSSSEYSMFYLTLLGAPWLVRERGHVFIEIFILQLPKPALNVLSRAVMLVCAVISLVLAWKGGELVLSNLHNSDYDVRTYFIPMWIFTITYPISFALMGVEFIRFVFSRDLFHSSPEGDK